MSNRAYLSRTKFEAEHDGIGWGWRLGDDYFRSYTDSCNEQGIPTAPLELLAKAVTEATDDERALFVNLLKDGKGISINGSWHEHAEIAPVLRKTLNEED